MLALLLGVFLFRQIVAPVRGSTKASRYIAAGDLEQRVSVTSRDEIRQLALTFNLMADALARDQRLRRTMMADIAHELRTPLSIIKVNLEAMQDGVQAGADKVTLAVEIAPDLPLLDVDADRIEQVFSNLLGNALRYTPAGGCITVHAGIRAVEGLSRAVVVEVADTGKGIDAADLPCVFDRFYRADKSRNRASGGSGIGLAQVKQLVEAHKGIVWVESAPGAGATFAIALPLPHATKV